MDNDKYIEVIDLTAYNEKRSQCIHCEYSLRCRGPVPHNTDCPKGFNYKSIFNEE